MKPKCYIYSNDTNTQIEMYTNQNVDVAKPLVVVDGSVEFLHNRIGLTGKTTTPKFIPSGFHFVTDKFKGNSNNKLARLQCRMFLLEIEMRGRVPE